ncbi:hypothetical protein CK203_117542 [Vitis vinifera]|uniref:Uncharacterized protein n=1 Tax=Vitis vinifera TaxID=29760 RepID=A0A438CP22_VITVI|nr:hypothetical protein CK203_117542 [Vitis vinifera]
MSTSSLEQAILKISKVIEDFVGEQQKINSHLNEKIDNLGEFNEWGKGSFLLNPTITFKELMQKRSRKVLKIDTLVGNCYDNSMDHLPLKIIRYDACKNRSYGENKGKQGRKAKTEQFAPPHFGNCWEHFDHFPKFISCVLYLISKLGKSGVHSFKRCSILELKRRSYGRLKTTVQS